VAAPVDILALIDAEQLPKNGRYTKSPKGYLRARRGEKEETWAFRFPWVPPPEYRLKLVMTSRTQESAHWAVFLSGGAFRFVMHFEWGDGDRVWSGLSRVGDAKVVGRRDARPGRVFAPGVPTTVTLVVRNREVGFELNGRPAYQWRGDFNAITDGGMGLGVDGTHPCDFTFEQIVLEPLGPDPGRPYGLKK
jgi:hypothetical protein